MREMRIKSQAEENRDAVDDDGRRSKIDSDAVDG